MGATLRRALDLARSQEARPFELRIALDLHDMEGEDARPLLEQLWIYLKGYVTLDLGYSYRQQRSVASLILDRLPATLLLPLSRVARRSVAAPRTSVAAIVAGFR